MLDAHRLIEGMEARTNISIKEILESRFKGLLHDQPEKLKRVMGMLSHPELFAVEYKSIGLQIFTASYILNRSLYRYSGRTGIRIGTVRIALVEDADLKAWLNLLDMGVLPMFVTHDVV